MKHPDLRYDSPVAFNSRQRLILAVAPRLLYWTLRGLSFATRVETIDLQYMDTVKKEHGRALMAVWHESLVSGINIYRNSGWGTLTSYSFDGELAARCCAAFGVHAMRGSSSRGGREGLHSLLEAYQHIDAIGLTVDGPRGPRRVAKPGIVVMSARTGVPIVPNALIVTPCWRLKSWDRMMIPKPFSRIQSVYGEPIAPPPDDSPEAVEITRKLVEDRLNSLHERYEIALEGPA